MKLLVGYLDNAVGKDALKLGIVLAEMLKSELDMSNFAQTCQSQKILQS